MSLNNLWEKCCCFKEYICDIQVIIIVTQQKKYDIQKTNNRKLMLDNCAHFDIVSCLNVNQK